MTMFVARSRNSSCAPGTTLPLGSRTVTVTAPSDPCCANALGRARNKARRVAANGRNTETADLRDIVNPPAHKIGLETDRQQPLAPAIPNEKMRALGNVYSSGWILYTLFATVVKIILRRTCPCISGRAGHILLVCMDL